MRRKIKKYKESITEFIQRVRREDKYANPEFNKIPKYYINLDRSKDRQKHMLKQFIDYEIENIEKFKAIDGNDIQSLREGEIDNVKYFNDYPNCTKYELAITLSHLECMRKGGEKGVFPFIIMEDDVDFLLINRWKKNIDQVIEEIPEDCDILHLFSHGVLKEGYHLNAYNCGAVCYIVTKQGHDKLLNSLYDSEQNIWNFCKKTGLDHILIDDGIKKLYNHYKYYPSLILQNIENFRSTHGKDFNTNSLWSGIYKKHIRWYMNN